MRTLINILLLLCGLGILFALVLLVGPGKILAASKDVDPIYISIGALVFLGSIVMRALRWYLMLRYMKGDTSFTRFFPLYFLNFMISNATPARSGEALAPFLLKKHIGSSTGEGFSIVLVDRIVELIFIVFITICGFVYCLFFADLPAGFGRAFYVALAVLLGLLGLLLLLALSKKVASFALNLLGKLFSEEKLTKLRNTLDSFYDGLDALRNQRVLYTLLLFAALSWMFVAVSYFLRARAILDAPFLHITSSWVISIGVGTASFIPSNLGAGQASFALLISKIFEFNLAQATAAALIAKVVALGVTYVAGIGSLLWIRRRGYSNTEGKGAKG